MISNSISFLILPNAQEILIWVLGTINTFLGYLEPIIYWGSKYVLVMCTIIYCFSKDKRAIHSGIKVFFIYYTFCLLRSVL